MLKKAASGVLSTREAFLAKRVLGSTVQVEGFTLNVSSFMFSQPET
jgi:hypothetical protein